MAWDQTSFWVCNLMCEMALNTPHWPNYLLLYRVYTHGVKHFKNESENSLLHAKVGHIRHL